MKALTMAVKRTGSTKRVTNLQHLLQTIVEDKRNLI
jgi:hypothetical protein